jgi:hypothetical protein
MKILRLCVTAVFVVVLVLFGVFQLRQLKTDKTLPTITVSEQTLKVGLNVTTEELLAGVTAYDKKDGDLTQKIIVESISRFVEPGVSIVKYVVCDSDNHVASATRRIEYTNYVPPRFQLSDSLVFNISQSISIRNILGAVDAIDGDISNKIIITSNEYTANIPGVYYISAKVTNSKGDMITQLLPVYVEEQSLSAPKIELRQYITYLKAGERFDIYDNVLSAVASNGEDLSSAVSVDTNLNYAVPGTYEVHYRVSDSENRVGHKIAIIIVE